MLGRQCQSLVDVSRAQRNVDPYRDLFDTWYCSMKLSNVPYDLGQKQLHLSLRSEGQTLSAYRLLFEPLRLLHLFLTIPPAGTGILRTRYELYGGVPQISRLV